ncbi:TauD/TfdA family dioxygenase [Fulvivirga imtechensis]|uniref:TauD/TfdA family dioxygenase n=1 Tax=Fulvivirga imtechensis TaxID=881893 RepID=UPI0012F9676C|nr:TauD/TfdA family dioxygenase [Fulvivirga imtechensis]
MVKPRSGKIGSEWIKDHKDQINQLLLTQGAVLLRGFDIGGAEGFNEAFSGLFGEPMEYKNRTSPREQVYNNVYTSTSHPKDQVIHMHTENSYSLAFNRIIAFYCLIPPAVNGETPIADERKILTNLKEETVQKFREKKIQYLRNSIPGVGLDWRTIYQTDDREAVDQYLEKNGFEYDWLSDEHLRVRWVLPAVQNHPITGEEMWFNHLYFGFKAHYDPEVLDYFNEEDLPFVTYYGDGSNIEDAVVQEFRNFYEKNSIVFKWEQDDFLLLDNMMFSHGRNPFEGERTILTAMAQPCEFQI